MSDESMNSLEDLLDQHSYDMPQAGDIRFIHPRSRAQRRIDDPLAQIVCHRAQPGHHRGRPFFFGHIVTNRPMQHHSEMIEPEVLIIGKLPQPLIELFLGRGPIEKIGQVHQGIDEAEVAAVECSGCLQQGARPRRQ